MKSTKLGPSRRIPPTLPMLNFWIWIELSLEWTRQSIFQLNEITWLILMRHWEFSFIDLKTTFGKSENHCFNLISYLILSVINYIYLLELLNFNFRFERNQNSVNNQNDEGKFLYKNHISIEMFSKLNFRMWNTLFWCVSKCLA